MWTVDMSLLASNSCFLRDCDECALAVREYQSTRSASNRMYAWRSREANTISHCAFFALPTQPLSSSQCEGHTFLLLASNLIPIPVSTPLLPQTWFRSYMCSSPCSSPYLQVLTRCVPPLLDPLCTTSASLATC